MRDGDWVMGPARGGGLNSAPPPPHIHLTSLRSHQNTEQESVMLQFLRPKSFRMWAVVASLFAVFNVSGASLGLTRDSDSPLGYCDSQDACADAAPSVDQRRRHSDVM